MRKVYLIFCFSLIFCPVLGFGQEMVKSVHVIVALCDNQNQGIVPVPKALGNGQNPAQNLYWGAMYGTKSF